MSDEQEITAPLEAEAMETGWADKTSLRPRCHAYIAFGAKTDLGRVRENNEDKFDFFEPDEPWVLGAKGRLYAVADGMGGHSAGQVASELSLNVFIRSYYSNLNPEVETCLRKAIREANTYVVDVARTIPGRNGMGATLTAAVVRDDDLFVSQVGDSRCYLLRDGVLQQVTEDHSWVAEQVRMGTMSLEEAEQSPFRNVITRSMGGAAEVEPDILAVKVQVGDRYLLCSDGLSGMVPDAELAELLAAGSPSTAAWTMVDRANQYGGKDNITAFVLHVVDMQPWPEEEGTERLPDTTEAQPAPEASAGANGHASMPSPEAQPFGAHQPASAPPRAGLMGRLFGRS
jgi:serine/threonine protein phosphatase PrpC